MIRPTVALAVAFNQRVRDVDEWFEEQDDLERVERAIASIAEIDDAVEAAAVIAARVSRSQAFGEGNKRTALLLARRSLDRNGFDGARLLPPNDRDVTALLITAAAGSDVRDRLIALLRGRA